MFAGFFNVYDDKTRADAYAELEFPGTYSLAFRDVPTILREYIQGRNAVDFGCGTGRSTRFLRNLGYDVVGVAMTWSFRRSRSTMSRRWKGKSRCSGLWDGCSRATGASSTSCPAA